MKQILKIQLEHTIRQLNSLSILMKVIAIFSEYYIRSYFIRSVGVTISSVSQLHSKKESSKWTRNLFVYTKSDQVPT